MSGRLTAPALVALALGLGGVVAALWVVGPGARMPAPTRVVVALPPPPAATPAVSSVTPATPAAPAMPAAPAAPALETPAPAGNAATAAPAPVTPPSPPEAIPVGGLVPAPDPGLVETAAAGPLPVIGDDGRQPWQVYARPFGDVTARPRIAIVVAGLGLRQSTTGTAIDTLPPAISLAFTPYARNLGDWVARARGAGHEVLIQVPMEPLDYPTSDPGPRALLTALSPAENGARLDWTLGRAVGYVGVMTYMGSRFTGQELPMAPVLDTLKARGLMILDSQTTARSVIPALAAAKGVPLAVATRAVDANPSRDAVRDRLAELERYARANGTAIGLAADYPGTLDELAGWAAGLEARGLVLAPLSALADTRPPAPPAEPAVPAAPVAPAAPAAPGKQG